MCGVLKKPGLSVNCHWFGGLLTTVGRIGLADCNLKTNEDNYISRTWRLALRDLITKRSTMCLLQLGKHLAVAFSVAT